MIKKQPERRQNSEIGPFREFELSPNRNASTMKKAASSYLMTDEEFKTIKNSDYVQNTGNFQGEDFSQG
jgi:hypothetical protein